MDKKRMETMDGNTAAAYVSYAFTDVAAIYPITPSTEMGELVDAWAAEGKKNIFGQEVMVKELQSEAGAAGTMHGSLQAGALTTTYTASQGLLLMIPNMFKMAGELLPGVFHVASRVVASHAINIFAEHQDVMSTRQTGFAILASGSVQEVMDLAGVAHLSAIKGRVPFLHFFDGFRTSQEIQKIEVMDYDNLAELVDYDALKDFRDRALNPERPVTRGLAQNSDVYFQALEASNPYYENIGKIVYDYMGEISKITGRDYKPFVYYGHPEAERVIVAMGSGAKTAEETVDYLMDRGEKVGVVNVHLFRPFVDEYFLDVIPKTTKKIAVLERTKEKGAAAEPLHLDVRNIYYNDNNRPIIVGGRYGLGSKDTTPSQILAVFNNLKLDEPRDRFTIGINDDVTHKSLDIGEIINTEPEGTIKCKFWGFGSDGTVGANQQAIGIIGENTDMYAQGYFAYDSKKSGGVTISHLRFGDEPIKSAYFVSDADFISCSKQSYVYQYDLLKGLKKGGIFLLNTIWDQEELDSHLPASLKKYIAENDIKFYTINATKIASEVGLGGRTNMIMQSAFFKLSEVLPVEEAVSYLKESIVSAYGHKGEDIVNMNYEAVDKGIELLVEVDIPAGWKDIEEDSKEKSNLPEFIRNMVEPINRQEGDNLPVSAFADRADGTFPHGTAAYEKRAIAVEAPHWIAENCIQCGQCSLVCPHAVIRPFLLNEEEVENAPEGMTTLDAVGRGLDEFQYRVQVSVLDCTGCGNCAEVCPSKEKSLVMKPFEAEYEVQTPYWNYVIDNVEDKGDLMKVETIKGSQFRKPYLEFSGACAGCGETAYAKLVTQLFGDRMYIANATGCSSIWGGSTPSTPYCTDEDGRGPAWANSLFEDNAEYGYGMAIAVRQIRDKIKLLMEEFIDLDVDSELNGYFKEWIDGMDKVDDSKAAAGMILPRLDKETGNEKADKILQEIIDRKEHLVKKSIWIFGGDGWAYDIGYGGLDHVMASGEDINVLVMDTEVYSNTGGQASKATPKAAVAKFAAAGKKIRKKDLGLMMTTYGYVYVAQIAMGANMNHTIKAINEAESYDGPSIIMAYSPCINHGIRTGMGTSVRQEKLAVDTGYWHLYRFDPRLADEGKNPFVLDSREPKRPFEDFINSEVRYTSLRKKFPEIADEMFERAENAAKERYESYKRMAEQN